MYHINNLECIRQQLAELQGEINKSIIVAFTKTSETDISKEQKVNRDIGNTNNRISKCELLFTHKILNPPTQHPPS